jgi:hypothetical protein
MLTLACWEEYTDSPLLHQTYMSSDSSIICALRIPVASRRLES